MILQRVKRFKLVTGPITGLLLATCILTQASPATAAGTLIDAVRSVEARLKGRVGIAVHDTQTGDRWAYKQDQRFPMASTFKAFACGAVLANVDAGGETLDRKVAIVSDDLVTYSPVTEKRVGGTMTVADLCEAAVTLSDNTAANHILTGLKGPDGFTAFMRSIGDETTRLDRWETDLNEARPGDERDTTSPHAAMQSLRKLALGDVLTDASRQQLTEWMLNDKVADALIRSVLPKGWRIADKTGGGGNGTRGILAIIWPPEKKPTIAAIYITGTEADWAARNAAIAEIGAAIIAEISPQ